MTTNPRCCDIVRHQRNVTHISCDKTLSTVHTHYITTTHTTNGVNQDQNLKEHFLSFLLSSHFIFSFSISLDSWYPASRSVVSFADPEKFAETEFGALPINNLVSWGNKILWWWTLPLPLVGTWQNLCAICFSDFSPIKVYAFEHK